MAVKRYKGKKSLKEPDEFITFSSKLLQQVILHKNKIISVLAGLVAIVLIVTIIGYVSKRSEDRSLRSLSRVMSRYDAALAENNDAGVALQAVQEDLTDLTETYDKKTAGKLATLFLADGCFDAGEFEQAEAFYRKTMADFKGIVPIEYLARSGLGYSLEEQGKHESAAEIFSALSEDTNQIMGDEVLFALGRQYAAMGSNNQEKDVAAKLIETYPQSIYVTMLKEKFPDLNSPES